MCKNSDVLIGECITGDVGWSRHSVVLTVPECTKQFHSSIVFGAKVVQGGLHINCNPILLKKNTEMSITQ